MDTEERTIAGTPRDLPIWARLAFIKMIPEVYFFDEARTKPRRASEARISGFCRTGDLVEIYYELDWPDEDLGPTSHLYCWPVMKT